MPRSFFGIPFQNDHTASHWHGFEDQSKLVATFIGSHEADVTTLRGLAFAFDHGGFMSRRGFAFSVMMFSFLGYPVAPIAAGRNQIGGGRTKSACKEAPPEAPHRDTGGCLAC